MLRAAGFAKAGIVKDSPIDFASAINGLGFEVTIEQAELAEFRRVYGEEAAKASVAVITGSLPLGTPAAFYRELVERTPCPAVLDFRGEGLLAALDLKPLVVKPNREELAQTMQSSLTDTEPLLSRYFR